MGEKLIINFRIGYILSPRPNNGLREIDQVCVMALDRNRVLILNDQPVNFGTSVQ